MTSERDTSDALFVRHELLGQGALGQVWRASVRGQPGREVALKTLRDDRAVSASTRRDFLREALALSSLDHASIPGVVDVGARGDAPYMAMQYVRGETLREAARTATWPQLQRWLLDVLGALAHAHARGVIHRDVKPDNILIARRGAARGASLVDFGLAELPKGRLVSAEQPTEPTPDQIAGTPAFMAPELVSLDLGPLGPWTDLYALGCTTWRLVCGDGPFHGHLVQVLRAHMGEEPGAFTPQIEVPEGLEGWVRWLMRKDVWLRCSRAADAAAALAQLDGEAPMVPVARAVAREEREDPTLLAIDPRPSASVDGEGPARWFAPAPPPDWRAPGELAGGAVERSSSLALWRARSGTLVGREEWRDVLWARLLKVCRDRTSHAVVLRDDQGHGADALARWIAERVDELGVAQTLRVTHGETPGDGDGFEGALARFFRAPGRPAAQTRAHIERFYAALGERDDPARLNVAAASHLAGASAGGPGSRPFESDDERRAFITRFIHDLASRRPLVVVVEGVDGGEDALRCVTSLLEDTTLVNAPTLFVVTTSSGGAIDGLADAEEITLPPATLSERRDALAAVFDLPVEILDEVLDRTGSVELALSVFEEWIDEGSLRQQDLSLELDPEDASRAPETFGQLWSRALDRMEREHGSEAIAAMEVAAALDGELDDRLWRACCAERAVSAGGLFDAMAGRGLIALRPRARWAFAHGTLAAALGARARAAGRWRSHNETCARQYMRMKTPTLPTHLERLATYWERAEDRSRAATLWLAAAQRRQDRGEFERLSDATARALELVGGLEAHHAERARIEARAHALMATSLSRRGELGLAAARAEKAVSLCDAHDLFQERGLALIERAALSYVRGAFEDALDDFRDALGALHASAPYGYSHARCEVAVDKVLEASGRTEERLAWLEQLLDHPHPARPAWATGTLYGSLAEVRAKEGRAREALELTSRALALSREGGGRRIEAIALAYASQTLGHIDAHGALTHALDARRLIRGFDEMLYHSCGARALLYAVRTRDLELASGLAQEALGYFSPEGTPVHWVCAVFWWAAARALEGGEPGADVIEKVEGAAGIVKEKGLRFHELGGAANDLLEVSTQGGWRRVARAARVVVTMQRDEG